jgi:hypothetical protein
MPCFEGFTPRLIGLAFTFSLWASRHTLLTEANCLDLIAFLRHHDVTFSRMRWRALWLVKTRDASPI